MAAETHLLSRYNRSMAVKLIALDIDGTLLDSRWTLPEANRAAIAEATMRGFEVALDTWRRYDFAMSIDVQMGTPPIMSLTYIALHTTHTAKPLYTLHPHT